MDWLALFPCGGNFAHTESQKITGSCARAICGVKDFFAVLPTISFSQSKLSDVDLLKLSLTHTSEVVYHNIRKLCSHVFSGKQTLQFDPTATIPSRDVSTLLLLSRLLSSS